MGLFILLFIPFSKQEICVKEICINDLAQDSKCSFPVELVNHKRKDHHCLTRLYSPALIQLSI